MLHTQDPQDYSSSITPNFDAFLQSAIPVQNERRQFLALLGRALFSEKFRTQISTRRMLPSKA